MADKTNQELIDGIMRDLARAGALGLIPQDGAKISRRGEFIVHADNVTEAEDKKMRGWRFHANEYPKALNGWGPDPLSLDPEAPHVAVQLVVKNREDEAAAVAAGWSLEAVTEAPKGADASDEPLGWVEKPKGKPGRKPKGADA